MLKAACFDIRHFLLNIQYFKRENPTGWRLWGLHRDGNIDRFLKPMLLYGLLLSHMFGFRFSRIVQCNIRVECQTGWTSTCY
jgi:hypothetical protein